MTQKSSYSSICNCLVFLPSKFVRSSVFPCVFLSILSKDSVHCLCISVIKCNCNLFILFFFFALLQFVLVPFLRFLEAKCNCGFRLTSPFAFQSMPKSLKSILNVPHRVLSDEISLIYMSDSQWGPTTSTLTFLFCWWAFFLVLLNCTKCKFSWWVSVS